MAFVADLFTVLRSLGRMNSGEGHAQLGCSGSFSPGVVDMPFSRVNVETFLLSRNQVANYENSITDNRSLRHFK